MPQSFWPELATGEHPFGDREADLRFLTLCLTCLVLFVVRAPTIAAQDVEPRVMSPAPVGTNIVGLSLGHSWGDVLLDKTLPVGDLDGGFSVLVPSYSRFFSLLGATTRFSGAIPVATGNWDALVETDSVETDISRTGFADAVASMTVFLLGAPSMTPEEFRDYRRRTILGFNLRLKVPIGQYDSERLVNLGSNRWQVAPALALSHWIGDFTLEAYAGMWAFSDNTSQLGDNVLSQDPLFAFQLNAGYSLRPHLWLSAGVRQTTGGREYSPWHRARDSHRARTYTKAARHNGTQRDGRHRLQYARGPMDLRVVTRPARALVHQ